VTARDGNATARFLGPVLSSREVLYARRQSFRADEEEDGCVTRTSRSGVKACDAQPSSSCLTICHNLVLDWCWGLGTPRRRMPFGWIGYSDMWPDGNKQCRYRRRLLRTAPDVCRPSTELLKPTAAWSVRCCSFYSAAPATLTHRVLPAVGVSGPGQVSTQVAGRAAGMRHVRADSKKEISSLAMGSGSSSGAK
jgi:hypothetical protein